MRMDKYVIYSPDYAPFQPKTFDNEEEAYDYFNSTIIEFLSKDGYDGVRFVLLKNGELIGFWNIVD